MNHTVTYWSIDKAGNVEPAHSLTLNGFSGFLSPLSSDKVYGLNRTIPVKFQARDANNNLFTDPAAALAAVTSLVITGPGSAGVVAEYVTNPGGPASVSGTAGKTSLRYDTTDQQFVFNWQTPKQGDGTYTINLTLADGTVHSFQVFLSKNGKGGALMTDSSSTADTSLAGSLLAGDVWVYVDNASGGFSADGLARVNDSVAGINAVTAPHGASVVLVNSPDVANYVMRFDTSSSLGSAADGVLGVTDGSGSITLLSGWNWYAGADASAIGAGQFDLQTVLTHEIGHSMGLGHSLDSASVMNATLATGQTRRVLIVADLDIPDTDAGDGSAHALLAAPASAAGTSHSTASDATFGPSAVPAVVPVSDAAPTSGTIKTVSVPASTWSNRPSAAMAIGPVGVGGTRIAQTDGLSAMADNSLTRGFSLLARRRLFGA